MALATLTQAQSGHCLIEGAMSFASVAQLLEDSADYLLPNSALLFDLQGVDHADSAGVALLVEWLRLARERQVKIEFRNIPAQMLAIIEVSDLQQRLPIVNGGA